MKATKNTNRRKTMNRAMTMGTALLAWALLATAPATAADKVVLMLNWYVYGEHAPFYYGKAKGIYAAENIDLEIQEGRGSAATTQAVAAKTADFGYVDVPTMMRAKLLRRSEEHTSELQSRQYLVCRLLLEKNNIPGSSRQTCHSPLSLQTHAG